jgi:hypothetical protein
MVGTVKKSTERGCVDDSVGTFSRFVRWLSVAYQVLAHAGLADVDTQLQEFTINARCTSDQCYCLSRRHKHQLLASVSADLITRNIVIAGSLSHGIAT